MKHHGSDAPTRALKLSHIAVLVEDEPFREGTGLEVDFVVALLADASQVVLAYGDAQVLVVVRREVDPVVDEVARAPAHLADVVVAGQA